MYPINSNVLSIFQNGSKQYFRMTIGSTVIDGSRVMQGSCSINRYVQTNESVAIGSVVASELTLSLNNYDGTYDNTDFVGSEAYVEIGVEDTNHTVQYIPMGYFTFDEATRTKNTVSLAALDRMTKFDVSINAADLSFPYTLTNLLTRICTLCGVTKGSFGTITNSSYSVASLPSEAKTYRDLLRWICEVSGSNGYFSYDGKLYLGWYGTTSQVDILPSNRTQSDIDKDTFTITGVTILTGDNQKYTAGTNVRPITINNNPFITASTAQSVANTLNTKLNGFTYTPFTATMLPSPHLWPMDRGTFTTADGTTVAVSVTEVTYKLNGNTSIGCKGEMQVRGRSYGLADQTFYASNIAAGAVTADKISVDDLAALQATIGGWTINETNLASSNNAVVLNSAGEIDVTETGSSATGAKIVATTSTNKAYYSAWGVRIETPPNTNTGTKTMVNAEGISTETLGSGTIHGASLTDSAGNPEMLLIDQDASDDWRNTQTEKSIAITHKDKTVTPNVTDKTMSLDSSGLYQQNIENNVRYEALVTPRNASSGSTIDSARMSLFADNTTGKTSSSVKATATDAADSSIEAKSQKIETNNVVWSTDAKLDSTHTSARMDLTSHQGASISARANNNNGNAGASGYESAAIYIDTSTDAVTNRNGGSSISLSTTRANNANSASLMLWNKINGTAHTSRMTPQTLSIDGHDLLRMSPHFAQMFATEIPANANLNTTTYLKCGQYYVRQNNTASSLSNCPTALAFKMTVETVNESGYDDETTNSWAIRTRTIVDYSGAQYVSYAYVSGTAGVWTYVGWKKVVTSDVEDLSSQVTNKASYVESVTVKKHGRTYMLNMRVTGSVPTSGWLTACNIPTSWYSSSNDAVAASVAYGNAGNVNKGMSVLVGNGSVQIRMTTAMDSSSNYAIITATWIY